MPFVPKEAMKEPIRSSVSRGCCLIQRDRPFQNEPDRRELHPTPLY